MLSKIPLPADRTYRTYGSSFTPLELFLRCFKEAKTASFILGYFSTSAFRTISLGFAHFIANGGTLRIISNDILSEEDKRLFDKTEEYHLINAEYFKTQTTSRSVHDLLESHFYDCLAYLVKHGRFEIKFIRPKNEHGGIAHEKRGLFEDQSGNKLYFMGSSNFSSKGILHNRESIQVTAQDDQLGPIVIAEFEKEMSALINENDPTVEYVQACDVGIRQRQVKSLDQLTNDAIQLRNLYVQEQRNPRLKSLIASVIAELEEPISAQPAFPFPGGPRDYQSKARENWIANDSKGIFDMATGTGKTVTSLNCVLENYKSTGSYQAVILVPTKSLLQQWESECESFGFRRIITIPSDKVRIKQKLKSVNRQSRQGSEPSFIVISTYASFCSCTNRSLFDLIPENAILICDEAHNVGAPTTQKALKAVKFQRRIGLSATITRQYDDAGNQFIEQFFKTKLNAPTFSFPMRKAIDDDILCAYYYYPTYVFLTENEQAEYNQISRKLIPFFDEKLGRFQDNEIVKGLLIKRARIIQKAARKLDAFEGIVQQELAENGPLKYTLVYTPEGDVPESSVDEFDGLEIDDSGDTLINLFTRKLSEIATDAMIKQFTSQSKNRDDILRKFEKGEIDVLTSMKCLDEGIDVKQTKCAIFCASTGNPRQFIQRRGRVLRTHSSKTFARIYDIVVFPNFVEGEDKVNKLNSNMIKRELQRVLDFANDAVNSTHALEVLQTPCAKFDIQINQIL